MQDHTHLYNASFIEGLYELFLDDPRQVDATWRGYFEILQTQQQGPADIPHGPVQRQMRDWAKTRRREAVPAAVAQATVTKQTSVLQLINAYRFRGHQHAQVNPLGGLWEPAYVPELSLEYHGLEQADFNTEFDTGSLYGVRRATLQEILLRLQTTYCGSIGAEYMHITETRKKRWIQQRLEGSLAQPSYDSVCKLSILGSLVAAEGLEHHLETQYVGQKRFSLEGGETLIPILDQVIQSAGRYHMKEVVFGMAHRGRLNVLVNIMGKSTKELYSEFEGRMDITAISGDVKYHQGYSSDVETPGGPVHLVLAFNPSHLEIISPVVEGSVRARQDRYHDRDHNQVLPVLIHGDAAFSGQGVVMETFNLSQTRGYKTGGTLHIVVNNQIGFTTSDVFDSRSTTYCTDVAKMVQAPIFHVNADDPEAAMFIANLALEYRMAFNEDVVVDLVCYRRQGHNEADEPAATQPMMYQVIKKHPTVAMLYAEKLIRAGILSPQDAEAMSHQYKAALKTQEVVSRPRALVQHRADWKPYLGRRWTESATTALEPERLRHLLERVSHYPEGFELHRSVERVMQGRTRMAAGEIGLDWGCAEALAFASLVEQGYPVRLSGQDSGRGTFAHRHAVLHDQVSGETYLPLQHVASDQAQFLVINSLLSEEAVLGFEFGFSSAEPAAMVLWEAQFGDFANGAQVVIDQFISSSEAKWQRLCGLVMLLPHGYDGQGPEHSSARIERFLQSCAEDNIQVCIPSTAAQYFHLLRRQMLRPYRKPLVVMTPKSMLRDRRSSSELSEFSDGEFQLFIDEQDPQVVPRQVRRVLLCSGQIYYKLLEARQERAMYNVAIVRLEQLYPFPRAALSPLWERYASTSQWFWVQEEPRNQGAWSFVQPRVTAVNLNYAGRMPSPSPAVGYLKVHHNQLQELLAKAFDLEYE